MSNGRDIFIALNFSAPTSFLVLDIDDKEDHIAQNGGEDYVRVDTTYSDRYWSQTGGDWYDDTGAGGSSDGTGKRGADMQSYEVKKPLRSGDVHDFSAMPASSIGFRIETYSGGDYYRFPQNTVDHDLNFNGNLGDEMAAWMDIVLADVPNTAPVLSMGGVSPSFGNVTTSFLFLVTYTDAENDTPACASVVIDGVSRAMSPSDDSYSDGCIFSLSTALKSGPHDHLFNFSDGRAGARLPASGAFDGPYVEIPVPPTISGGTVVPANGTPETVFRFRVRYNDSNNDPPVVRKVNIDGAGHDMTANGTDYRGGCEYFYDTRLAAGEHGYSFFFGDKTGSMALPATGRFPGPTVEIPNEPPQYNESANRIEIPEDTVFFFDLNGLFWDPDGDPLEFVHIGGAPDNLTVDIAGNGSAILRPSHDYFTAQEILRFRAQDPLGANRTGELMVTIKNVNDPPYLLPGGMVPDPREEIRVNEGEALTFRVSAADIDNKTSELKYTWSIDDVEKTKLGTSVFTWRSAFDDQGPHNVKVRISDGLSCIDADWNITVNDTNRAPMISEAWPVNNTEVAYGTSISFCATANDPDGDPVTFYWRLSDGTLLNTQSGVKTSSFSKVLPGGMQHLVVLDVQDGNGGIARQYIYIRVGGNLPPNAAIDAPENVTSRKAVSFSAARSTDTDGRIVRYIWDFGDGGTAEGANVDHTYNRTGTYDVRLTVTDNNNATSNSSMSIKVKAPPAENKGSFIPGFGGVLLAAAAVSGTLLRRKFRKAERQDI
jgi:hypothetical protein